jgi:hypothetical protein
MKNIIRFILFLGVLISLNACDPEEFFTPVVDVEIPVAKPKIVLMSYMWAGQDSMYIYVSKSRNLLDNKPYNLVRVDSFFNGQKWVKNVFPITDTIGNLKLEFLRNGEKYGAISYLKDGIYQLILPRDLAASDRSTFTLRAEAPGFEPVEASQKIPQAPRMDTVILKENVKVSDPSDPTNTPTVSELAVNFKDPADEANFYGFETILETKIGNLPWMRNNNYYLYLNSYDPLAVGNLFKDLSFNGKSTILRTHIANFLGFGGTNPSFRIRLFMTSLTPERYSYEQSVRLIQETQDNPFAEPVTQYTNIKNGFGIFSMSSSSEYLIPIK